MRLRLLARYVRLRRVAGAPASVANKPWSEVNAADVRTVGETEFSLLLYLPDVRVN